MCDDDAAVCCRDCAALQAHSSFYDGPSSFATSEQRICYGNWVFWRHRKSFDIVNRKRARKEIIRLFSDGSFAYFADHPETPAILVNSGGSIKDVTSQVPCPSFASLTKLIPAIFALALSSGCR
jgi:hypothetical protein